jgi:hypothetical protein
MLQRGGEPLSTRCTWDCLAPQDVPQPALTHAGEDSKTAGAHPPQPFKLARIEHARSAAPINKYRRSFARIMHEPGRAIVEVIALFPDDRDAVDLHMSPVQQAAAGSVGGRAVGVFPSTTITDPPWAWLSTLTT